MLFRSKRRHQVVVANLTDRAVIAEDGPLGIQRIILLGGARTHRSEYMPSWRDTLSMPQVRDLTDYVMTLPERVDGIRSSTERAYRASRPGYPIEGHRLFLHQCASCHGTEGKGDGRMAGFVYRTRHVRVRDLTDTRYLRTRTDRDLYMVISAGGGANGKSTAMPHWGGYLVPEQIKDLVAYVRSISGTRALAEAQDTR